MTIDEIINKTKTEGYAPEALAADITSIIGEAVKAKAESIESALTELGYKAPEGVSAREHVVNTVSTLKAEAASFSIKNTELASQVERITKNAPKAEEIRAEFELKLKAKDEEVKTLTNSIAKNQRLAKLSEITSGFKYDATLSEQAKRLLKVELSELDSNFGVEDREGVLILLKNGVTHKDDAGRIVTAEAHLRNAMEPFFEKAAAPKNPEQPTPGQKVTFKTTEEKREYAKAHNIDIYSKAGQEQLRKLDTPPPSV